MSGNLKNPPAFPRTGSFNGGVESCFDSVSQDGMTLRDYFAAAALQGMLANSGGPIQANSLDGWGIVNTTRKDVASDAYIFADAMLAARSAE